MMLHRIRLFGVRYRCPLTVERNSSRSISPSSIQLNSTMNKLISAQQYKEALDLFDRQVPLCTDVTFTLALKASTKLSDEQRGIRIHQQLSSNSLQDPFIQTSLIHFYMQCHRMDDAQHIFSGVKTKTIFMYGAMLKGYLSNNIPKKVIELYEQMPMEPNEVIIVTLFNACAKLSDAHAVRFGRDVLNRLPKPFLQHTKLITSAIHMLMNFGEVPRAERLFEQEKNKSIVTYGAMMQGYMTNKQFGKALDFFERIPFESNEVLHLIVYNVCASLADDKAMKLGNKIFQAMPRRFRNHIPLMNSAIHMHMNFGQVQHAESLFKQILQPTLHSYGVMINGYKINEQPQQCLGLFEQMKKNDMKVNEPIAQALVSASAQLGMRSICERIVKQIDHVRHDQQLRNSLIDMWGKSGHINRAEEIFRSISHPDAFTYTNMINAYGLNGMGLEAIDAYERMPETIRNAISHVCVLNACSHSGLVDQARLIFNRIDQTNDYVVTTMVDCLSRLGLFDEAQELLYNYDRSNPPSMVMYMALLSGARNHRRVVLCEQLYERMKCLFPEKKDNLIAASVLVSNTYSSSGDELKAKEVRLTRMKQFGKNIKVGASWTEVNGELVIFQAHDRSHPCSPEIYAQVDRFSEHLKAHGHEFDSTWITRPLYDGEDIESVLCGHSEKLAIAYNIIQRPQPSFIQITKNLRVCGDCHRATKVIAKVYKCQIVVRDANRIHHFSPNGQCSCQDHF